LSKHRRKKKSDKQIERLTTYIDLIIAILQLLAVIISLIMMTRGL